MKIREIEVDFDFLDADDVERFENAAKRVVEECANKEKKEMSYAEVIREECKIIDRFFDDVFGNGISEKLFNGKKNLSDHVKAFEDIVKMKNEKQKDLQSTLDRYQPNREQRRYNQFKGNRR